MSDCSGFSEDMVDNQLSPKLALIWPGDSNLDGKAMGWHAHSAQHCERALFTPKRGLSMEVSSISQYMFPETLASHKSTSTTMAQIQ